jgi:group I intron endonuclease
MSSSKKTTGLVYLLTNKINGKKYVGQTTQIIKRRIARHKDDALHHPKYPINFAIRKYGMENFECKILKDSLSFDQMDFYEKKFIKELKTRTPGGYNCESGGCKLKTHSEKSKKKTSNTLKKKYKDGFVNPAWSRKYSDEEKNRMRERSLGEKNPNYGAKSFTKETRKKLSKAMSLKTGEKNSFYGRKHRKESIDWGRITQFKKGLCKSNKSGFKGVCWIKKNKKWRVIVNRKHIGFYKDVVEAAKSYDAAAIEILGKENITTNKDLGLY